MPRIINILSELAAVFTDKESAVRAAAICLLQFLAPKVRVEHISPFFPLVSAHLSSAMTHISEGIQRDSLKVLDILLDQYPTLLMDCSSVLLNNFVELISHQQLSKQKNGDKLSWKISVNPNSRVTSQHWRLNVLIRLRKFLQVLVEGSSTSETDSEGLQEPHDSLQVSKNSLQVNWQEHASGQMPIQLYEKAEFLP